MIEVTNLADVGPGSLRACAEAEGVRTCIFRVSGTIEVDDWIQVTSPYLTVAGQTSPGGIALKVRRSKNTPLLITTHDVIVRHLRVRPGPPIAASSNVDTIQISGGARDVILDHLSTSWPTDEGINIVGPGHSGRPGSETHDITVQWSILAEGLNRSNHSNGNHSRGTYFGYGASSITFHHNLVSSNFRRNPLINTIGQFDFINNIIYNSGEYNLEAYTRFGNLSLNAIGNVAIVGPSSRKNNLLSLISFFRDQPAEFAVFVKDNLDLQRPRNAGDERLVLAAGVWSSAKPSPLGAISLQPEAISPPEQAYADILAHVGATRPRRDAADERVLDDVRRCRGRIIDDPSEVGGWPQLTGGTPPADEDHDGMADDWERMHGLSSSDPEDGNRIDGRDGYTNLERYLNNLAGDDTGSLVGTGQAQAPDPACGFGIARDRPVPRVEISASPALIRPGEPVTIAWRGENLKACKADWGPSLPSGSITISPASTRSYGIVCSGIAGSHAIDSTLVTVDGSESGPRQR